MNQFRLSYIYTWKCHKETPCIAILRKLKCLFCCCYKIGEQEGRTDPVWVVGTSANREDVGKEYKRVNIVQIL
jgi:hypothetical protein